MNTINDSVSIIKICVNKIQGRALKNTAEANLVALILRGGINLRTPWCERHIPTG